MAGWPALGRGDLRLEPYEADKHYPLIAAWWQGHDNACLPVDCLPKTGAIAVSDNDGPVAASFCFLSNSAVAFLAFPICQPGLPARTALKALAIAINGAVAIARVSGAKMIWSTTENGVVDHVYTKVAGFKRSTPHTNYFLLLDPTICPDMLVGAEYERSTP